MVIKKRNKGQISGTHHLQKDKVQDCSWGGSCKSCIENSSNAPFWFKKCSSIVDKMSWRQAFHFYNYFWRGGVMCHLNIRISCTIGVLCTAGVLLGQWFWWKIISIMELFYWCRENLQSSQEWGTLLQPSGCYWGSWQVLFSYQLDFSVQLCWLNTELVLNKAVTAFGKKGVQLQLWWQKCLSEVV